MDMENEIHHEENVATDHQGNNFVCEFCSKTYKHKGSLTRHVKIHQNRDFRCDVCNNIFKSNYNLKQHIKRQHQKKNNDFICHKCGKKFNSQVATSNHIKFKHSRGGVECSICDKRFKDNYGLTRHMISHDDNKEKCKKCGLMFKDVASHMQKCGRRKLSTRSYACEICQRKFLCKRYLKSHIKNKHQGGDPFTCQCGKMYFYKYCLKRHQKICTCMH